jgi:hypothetical protein
MGGAPEEVWPLFARPRFNFFLSRVSKTNLVLKLTLFGLI